MRATISSLGAAVLCAVFSPSSVARAQGGGQRAAEPVCLGFAFGPFTPRLDWKKAGHAPVREGTLQRAPDGRDWASDQALPNDSSLYLFPAWWPVGIWVELSTRAPAPGDTVTGRATALVARGDIVPPVATVRAWRVPCGPAPPAPTPGLERDSAAQRTRPRD